MQIKIVLSILVLPVNQLDHWHWPPSVDLYSLVWPYSMCLMCCYLASGVFGVTGLKGGSLSHPINSPPLSLWSSLHGHYPPLRHLDHTASPQKMTQADPYYNHFLCTPRFHPVNSQKAKVLLDDYLCTQTGGSAGFYKGDSPVSF